MINEPGPSATEMAARAARGRQLPPPEPYHDEGANPRVYCSTCHWCHGTDDPCVPNDKWPPRDGDA